METIEKKFELRYLITANDKGRYAVHPSILRFSDDSFIENTKVVIPIELEMPEEILPYVKNIKASLLLGAEPERKLGGWLGIEIEQGKDGVAINGFESGSPAIKSPLYTQDVVVTINGREIKTVKDFNEFMNKTRPGQIISIRYLNNGTERTTNVTLGERP